MSGRYAFFRWNQTFASLPGYPADHQPHWNIAPGAQVLFQREVQGQRELAKGRWGLTPAWLKDLSKSPAHARAESLASQPMFRESFVARRCLIPANGFYEWRGSARKRPYWITHGDPIVYFAGLWETYPTPGCDYLSVAMITTAAASLRRPLLLDAEEQHLWLSADSEPAALLTLLTSPRAPLRERALAHFVNDPKLDAPECLTPA